MKKTLLFVLMLIATLAYMPVAYAADVEIDLAEFEDITNEDTLMTEEKGSVSTEGDVTTLTYTTSTFRLLANGVGDRPDGYAWIGVRLTQEDEDVTQYSTKVNDSVVTSKTALPESKYVDEYFGINVANLTTAAQADEVLTYKYEVTWYASDDETTKVQTVNVVVYPDSITLLPKGTVSLEESEPVWDEDIYLATTDKVRVTFGIVIEGVDEDLSDFYETVFVDKETAMVEDEDDQAALDALVAELQEELASSGYVFDGFYSDADLTTKYDVKAKVSADTTIYISLKKAPVTTPEDNNPATGDNVLTIAAFAGVALVATLGTAIALKKVNE